MKLLLKNYRSFINFILMSCIVIMITSFLSGCMPPRIIIKPPHPPAKIQECNEDLYFQLGDKAFKDLKISKYDPRKYKICGGQNNSYIIGKKHKTEFIPHQDNGNKYIYYTDNNGIRKKHKVTFSEDLEVTHKCNRCGGIGNIICTNCEGEEKIVCPKCQGAGFIEDNCDSCKGSGKGQGLFDWGVCNKCSGEGKQKEDCPKEIDCDSCKGDARIPCPNIENKRGE